MKKKYTMPDYNDRTDYEAVNSDPFDDAFDIPIGSGNVPPQGYPIELYKTPMIVVIDLPEDRGQPHIMFGMNGADVAIEKIIKRHRITQEILVDGFAAEYGDVVIRIKNG